MKLQQVIRSSSNCWENKMNIISSNQTKNTVSLEQLVPQHDCLKLLILHTPYTLNISTLPLCLNLIKLDLSKNNLQTFPYLGRLQNLKFLFIHENKLDIDALKGIFEQNSQKSHLSENIVWATFWGNKNAFLGRHYLITQTSAIAVDKNLVAYEQQCDSFPFFKTIPPFHQSTDISHLLRKKMISRHATEEQYMNQLWIELRQLRKKHEHIFPILRIQKWARGWLVRNRFSKTYQNKKIATQNKQIYFQEWKNYILRQKKLRKILRQNHKEYLLERGKQGRVKQIIMKVIQRAKQAKQKIIIRKLRFSNQLKVYNLIRQNYLTLKGLYETLALGQSNAIYIHRSGWSNFQKHVVPMVKNKNSQNIVALPNKKYLLQAIFDCFSQNTNQFVKIINTNLKSSVFQASKKDTNIKKLKRYTERLNLKKIYQPIHISTKRSLQIKEHQSNLEQRQKFALEELVKIEGSQSLLKDIVRAIYFHNITNREVNNKRVNFFTENMLKKVTSAVKIQKVWRGFTFRKRNQKYLKTVLKMQRAAIIIQRWARKLPMHFKKYFMIKTIKQLNKLSQKSFFIEMNDYLDLVKQKEKKGKQEKKAIFMQQDCGIYLNKQSQMLCLGWNRDSNQIEVIENLRMGKIMFSNSFFNKVIGLTPDQIIAKVKYNPKWQMSDISHLFHYQTTSTTIRKQNKNYLEISFSNKSEAKLRFLTLKLLTYSFKNNNGIRLLNNLEMGSYQICKRIKIESPDKCIFVCNENINLLKICEEKLSKDNNMKLFLVNNKFYVKGQKKVMKMEQKFIIYASMIDQNNHGHAQQTDQKQQAERVRYRTEIPSSLINNNDLILRQRQTEMEPNYEYVEHQPLRKVLNKRSMKQFKIDKRLKHKKQNPSFILDSVSINERLTTQPDYLPTYQSNAQNSMNPNQKAAQKQQKQIQMRSFKSEVRPRQSYADKSKALSKRKEEDTFVKRFVNIGNFIQNQFANDYRRRIKTQTQHSAIESAENVRRSLQRSHSQRMQNAQEKLKTIKERHSMHKQVLINHQLSAKQKFERLKTEVREERDKRIKDKGKVKRLKVSFAEECFPLANRMKKTDYFP